MSVRNAAKQTRPVHFSACLAASSNRRQGTPEGLGPRPDPPAPQREVKPDVTSWREFREVRSLFRRESPGETGGIVLREGEGVKGNLHF